ncbi:MAG TPA: hypothetical protein VFV70_04615 [Hyphomonadaceae bacterium]|nr:hypothetical protein [Hyphomonadaceae bacterium]
MSIGSANAQQTAPAVRVEIDRPQRSAQLKPYQAFVFFGLSVVLLLVATALVKAALGVAHYPAKLQETVFALHFWLVFAAIPLALVQIALPKGTVNHRLVGYAWCALLVGSATVSFAMHELTGGFSPPHAFSILTLVMVPLIVFFARSHRVVWHRNMVLGLCLVMILAGVLTFIPGRAIGSML